MAPQIGTGTIVVTLPGSATPIAYICSRYDAVEGYRELVVAKRGALCVPINTSRFELNWESDTYYATPKDAEDAYLLDLGIVARSSSDRWWVKSTSNTNVVSYSNPSGNLALYQAFVAIKPPGVKDIGAWAQFIEATGSNEIKLHTYLALRGASAPEDFSAEDLVYTPDSPILRNGNQIEDWAKDKVETPLTRYEILETIEKLSGDPPATWAA